MEVYAAMVSNLDGHIGRLVQYLRDTGQYENTLIFFMSDNGSDSNPAGGSNVTASTDLASMGRPGTSMAYGERWAEVSAAPFRLWKTFTGAEGSVSVPAIVKLPGQRQARVPLTTTTLVKDLLPTFLEVANIAVPTDTYAGRDIEPISGVSLHSALKAESASPEVRPASETVTLEYLGQGYVHRNDGWKLSRTGVPGVTTPSYDAMPWRLFNVRDDRGETRDRAAERPDILEELKKEWERYVLDNGVLLPATPPAAKRDPASL